MSTPMRNPEAMIALLDNSSGRPGDDGLAFNDPAAWGYCDICAFLVGAKDGIRLPHRYDRTHPQDRELCTGGGKPSVTPTPVFATRLKMVSLKKSESRAERVAFWQKRRFAARAMIRFNEALVRDSEVERDGD